MNVMTKPEAALLDTVVQMRGRYQVHVDHARDALLTEFGRATLDDRYLLPGETYQDLFARVASYYGDDQAHAQRLYDYISKLWFMPATPVLSNGGTDRGLPISCFLNEASDSLEGIVGALERECLAGLQWRRHRHLLGQCPLHRRKGEGRGQDLGHHPLHPRDGQPDPGDLPGLAAPRLGRGLSAISHPEIEEFVEIRSPTGGDPNRKALNLHHGICSPTSSCARWKRINNGRLRSPKDNSHVRAISARALWVRILDRPHRDRRAVPDLLRPCEQGAAPSSTSSPGSRSRPPTCAARSPCPPASTITASSAPPCAASPRSTSRPGIEWHKDEQFIEDVMRFLDNVLEDFIRKAPRLHGEGQIRRLARAFGRPRRDGLPLLPAGPRTSPGKA